MSATTFDRATLAHVARLARLPLSADEEARFSREIGEILAAFETLPAQARASEAPMASALRPDEPAPSMSAERDAIVAAFPRRDGDRAKVPRGL